MTRPGPALARGAAAATALPRHRMSPGSCVGVGVQVRPGGSCAQADTQRGAGGEAGGEHR